MNIFDELKKRKAKQDVTYFTENFVHIEDRDSVEFATLFKLWNGQKKSLEAFRDKRLNIVLKGRQLGLTWLALAYAVRNILFKPGYQVVALSRREDDAKELVRRVAFILRYLPPYMILPGKEASSLPAWDSTSTQVIIYHPGAEPSIFKSLPAAADSGRSLTANLIILDEWAFQTYDREIWAAAYPTINRPTGGQVIGISTIKRGSLFEELWEKSKDGSNNFNRIFLGWQTDPRRTPAWYEQTKKDIGDNIFSEYPGSEEEAFLTPGGSFFSEVRAHIHLKKPENVPDWYKRYVSLDYGLDALAALWYWVDREGNARVYKELYVKDLIISEAAKVIKRANGRDEIEFYYAPPDLWNRRQDTGKSASQIFAENGINLVKTSNDRLTGWMNVKEYLAPYDTRHEQTGETYTTAKMTIEEGAAPNLWRCLQKIQKSESDPNDVADQPHELTHCVDSLRAFCVARMLPSKQREEKPHYNWEFERRKDEDDNYSKALGDNFDESFFNYNGDL